MTDAEQFDALRKTIEKMLTEVYVTKRAEYAMEAAREEIPLEAIAAIRVTAGIAHGLNAIIHGVADGRRREPFF